MTFGRRGFFGYQVADSGEVYWFANQAEREEPDRDRLAAVPDRQWRDELLARHDRDHAPIAEILRSTTGPIGRWPIHDLPSLPRWHHGRVCLVGDAAHATSPHVGQGASLAMEDAVVLAKCLRDVPETGAAFAAFESLRRGRVERLVKAAQRTGNQKVPATALGRAARDVVLPLFLRLGVRANEPVYRYRVDWDEPIVEKARA
ncbi:FAD-dependent monooxygenase [Micromonospora fluostatini]|uniref:FAD-dependent monooxygenase n=1 Tax=Micromonospora sp. JCM 30529 TaxID=3421643 RepID=UPI003D167C3A